MSADAGVTVAEINGFEALGITGQLLKATLAMGSVSYTHLTLPTSDLV